MKSCLLQKVALGSWLLLAGMVGAVAQDRVKEIDDPAAFVNLSTQLSFSSPLEAYRQGKVAYDEGWYSLALPALRFAAKRGVLGARLKLAKMCELGLGMPRDEAAAFDLYKTISDKHWNIPTYHPVAPYIGEALASLGVYYLNGVEDMGMSADPRRAATYFTHASQFFGNPRAQYNLAKLYLSGHGIKKNPKRAVAWLNNATKKKHAPSQALLGQLFWEGSLVPKQQIKALALLTMARENAGPADSEWIDELHKSVVAASDLRTRKGAKTAVARWVKIYRPRDKRNQIIIRKEVRIGIAESGEGFIEEKQTIQRRTLPDLDDREWTRSGRFRKVNAR